MKSIKILVLAFITTGLLFVSCNKDSNKPTPPATGKFTATVNGNAFSSPDPYLMTTTGGRIAVIAKDSKGRSFNIAIFEKDFPLNQAVNVQFSPSISYHDENAKAYIAVEGKMTITAYGKNNSGDVTNLKGNFEVKFSGDGGVIVTKNGLFDVNKK